MASSSEIPDPVSDYKGFSDSLFTALKSAVQAANAVPTDLNFYRIVDPTFAKNVDHAGSHSLNLSNKLLQHCADHTGLEFQSFQDVDQVKDHYTQAEDVIDKLLERAGMLLDKIQGRTSKVADTMKQSIEENRIMVKMKSGTREVSLTHGRNIERPQLKFKDKIDNSSRPFEPFLPTKPHAIVPLNPDSLSHPYKHEIEHIIYPEHMFERSEPQMYRPFETTTATWVDTEDALEDMMGDLKGSREIAVDLEHHEMRSYQGFTCLMQISTREQDYIVDTLVLRDKLWKLNEYFADPKIVKIFHGANSDIQWLQRDFGLYVVNLFDTYWATKFLEFPHHSLAYLLQKYCSVEADKKQQLADWRIRPLREDMLKYARADTHYLHYIYDELRNALLDRNLMQHVLKNSADVSLIEYVKEAYDAKHGTGSKGWAHFLKKNMSWTPQQVRVYKAIHQWRDVTARNEDESLHYVLPKTMLITLTEKLPTESAEVIACGLPCPPLVRMNAQDIARLIQRAKMDTSESSDMDVDSKAPSSNSLATKVVQSSKTGARHKVSKLDPSLFDLQKIEEQRTKDVQKHAMTSSALFGPSFDILVGYQNDTQQLVLDIQRSIKSTLPIGVPMATAPVISAEPTASQEEDKEELVFVPEEDRQTKKRKNDETVVLRNSAKAKKKKSAKNT